MSTVESSRWGVYVFGLGWLVDTCAGGTWSFSVNDAAWFQTLPEAYAARARSSRPGFATVFYPRMK